MKKLLIVLAFCVVIAVAAILLLFKKDTLNPYAVLGCDLSVPNEEIPGFTPAQLDWTHQFDGKIIHPLMGSAVIDVDGDGLDELFLGAGLGQANALFRYAEKAFSEDTSITGLPAGHTIGVVSFDLDNSGSVDLILTREDGVWFLANDGAGNFSASRLAIEPDEKSTPATVTLGDYDRDGLVDIFLCTYIKLDLMEGQTIFTKHGYGANSILLRNKGGLEFEDVTEQAGLTYTHNTFQATFVDLDDSGSLDLVVAYDTGEARIYGNNGDGTFKVVETPMTGRFGYPMGLGLGDYNNDGRADLFFSNTGTTVPEFLARGDLKEGQDFNKEWMLWRNDGDLNFTDVAKEANVAGFEFSWGGIFEDFNLDGRQDLVVAESYVAFPPHALFALPCRFLIQRENFVFASVEQQAGVVNKNFAITPLTADWNADGYPDLVWANLKGPARAFLSKGGSNRSLRVRIPEQGITPGTKVVVETSSGKTLTDWYIIGEGLASDQSNVLTFGLGATDSVVSVTATFPDGKAVKVEAPELGTVIDLKPAA